jgi:hypothetical protein
MDIEKQLVDNQVNLIMKEFEYELDESDEGKRKSKAFLLYGVASYFGLSFSEALTYLTDGGNDGGFDAAYLDEDTDSQLSVILFQSKYTRDLSKESHFPANAIEKAINTVKTIFDPAKDLQLNSLSKAVADQIKAYIYDGYIPSVKFVCMSNGIRWNVDGDNHIKNEFKNSNQVEFEFFNHKDMIKNSGTESKISYTLPLSGKALKEDYNYKSVILGKAKVFELYKLMDEKGNDLLNKNVRNFLGSNKVNDGIKASLLSDEGRPNFFFLNNGITMVCSKSSANFLQSENWLVQLDNLQIINGGQTCKTIHQTISENRNIDFEDAEVLVRIYEVSGDDDVVQDIAYATNSQNPVDFKDLKSNDEKQKLLEKGAALLKYSYKRKRDNSVSNSTNNIPSAVAAESVLAIWRQLPSVARNKKNDHFSTYYDLIFNDLNAAQMIVAVTIFRYCDNMRRKTSSDNDIDSIRRFSNYDIAMIMGDQILKNFNIELCELTHNNFEEIFCWLNSNIESLFADTEHFVVAEIKQQLGYISEKLYEIDGRTLSSAFRRNNIRDSYLRKRENYFSHSM